MYIRRVYFGYEQSKNGFVVTLPGSTWGINIAFNLISCSNI